MVSRIGTDRYLDVRSLDKWLIIGPNEQQIRIYIDNRFIYLGPLGSGGWMEMAPVCDPLDPVLVRIATQDSNIKGQIYHEIINLMQGDVVLTPKQSSLVREAYRNKRIRDLNQTHMHPQPLEYEGDTLWERNLHTPELARERHLSMYSDRWSLLENNSVDQAGISVPVSQMVQTKPLGVARRLSADPLR